jgi:hypothetical protein
MAENPNSGKSLLFWLAIVAAVAVAIFLIAKFLFPELVKEFTGFIVGLFVVVTGLIFRRRRKNT